MLQVGERRASWSALRTCSAAAEESRTRICRARTMRTQPRKSRAEACQRRWATCHRRITRGWATSAHQAGRGYRGIGGRTCLWRAVGRAGTSRLPRGISWCKTIISSANSSSTSPPSRGGFWLRCQRSSDRY